MQKNTESKRSLMKLLGRILGVFIGIAIFLMAMPLKTSYAASAPPPYTTSWYVDISNPSSLPATLYNMGCALGTHDYNTPGTQDDVVILLFGKPGYYNSHYGAYDWASAGSFNTVFLTTAQIAAGVEQFGKGYYICSSTDKTSLLHLAAGVNNYGSTVGYYHGSAWAKMITSINSWIYTNGYSSQVFMRGANDMELDYSKPSPSIAWVNGYTASYGPGLWLYDTGDAAGCPLSGSPTSSSPCNNSWTVGNVWYVSWGTKPLYPLPEIYNTTGANADQWYLVSLYSALYKGGPLFFPGTLTQYEACQQMGGCAGINNTPSEGWTQLWNAINSNTRTAQSYLRWSTDMEWR